MDYLLFFIAFIVTWPIAGIFTGWLALLALVKKDLVIVNIYNGHPLSWWHLGWIVFLEMLIGAPHLLYIQHADKKQKGEALNG